ncbi:MAG: peptidase [Candidatus Cloacimonadota bacterium]|nr:MAG: peptidase [Candidatus Cloacimonadota bacterium]PIE79066.1 MAG: peptidase [Candidatus Delongbacteria bacterium]
MKKPNWRKWNLALHRDLGFFFFGMTIIYALSGMALNHKKHYNPSFKVINEEIQLSLKDGDIDDSYCKQILKSLDIDEKYKRFYFQNDSTLKIIFLGGNLKIDMNSHKGNLSRTVKRKVFNEISYLHYNPIKTWTWFSDLYALGLIILSFTGIIITKGKKGLWGRGGIYLALGIAIPIVYLFVYKF